MPRPWGRPRNRNFPLCPVLCLRPDQSATPAHCCPLGNRIHRAHAGSIRNLSRGVPQAQLHGPVGFKDSLTFPGSW